MDWSGVYSLYHYSMGQLVYFPSSHQGHDLCMLERDSLLLRALVFYSARITSHLFSSLSLFHQAKQLKDYENAVIAKRLEELDEDEVQALVEDIERDDF